MFSVLLSAPWGKVGIMLWCVDVQGICEIEVLKAP